MLVIVYDVYCINLPLYHIFLQKEFCGLHASVIWSQEKDQILALVSLELLYARCEIKL
jgi:hypothetical protein